MKELYIAALEELVEEMMEADPSLTREQAYDLAAVPAYERTIDRFAVRADAMRMKAKED